jgi:hypothetical protein
MKDKLPGGIEPYSGRLRLPELDIEGAIQVLQAAGSL